MKKVVRKKTGTKGKSVKKTAKRKPAKKTVKRKMAKGGEIKLMKDKGVILLEGEKTIKGQIDARQKALNNTNKDIALGDKSDFFPRQLQAWKELHENQLEILNNMGDKKTVKRKTDKKNIEIKTAMDGAKKSVERDGYDYIVFKDIDFGGYGFERLNTWHRRGDWEKSEFVAFVSKGYGKDKGKILVTNNEKEVPKSDNTDGMGGFLGENMKGTYNAFVGEKESEGYPVEVRVKGYPIHTASYHKTKELAQKKVNVLNKKNKMAKGGTIHQQITFAQNSDPRWKRFMLVARVKNQSDKEIDKVSQHFYGYDVSDTEKRSADAIAKHFEQKGIKDIKLELVTIDEDSKNWHRMGAGGEIHTINAGGQYLSINADNNKMTIKLTPEGVEEVNDMRADSKSDIQIMSDLFEDIQANSEIYWHDDLGNVGLGLTSASGVTEGYDYDDNGDIHAGNGARLYYFNDYAIRSEIDDLLNGELVLTGYHNVMGQGGELTTWGGAYGRININQLTFNKVDYDVNVDLSNKEVDIDIKQADTVDHLALNDTEAKWSQFGQGYMVYPKTVEQLYKVLKALRCNVSKPRLTELFVSGEYGDGGTIGFTQKDLDSGKNYSFSGENDIMYIKMSPLGRNSYFIMFNAKPYDYYSYPSFKKKVEYFIDKYKLKLDEEYAKGGAIEGRDVILVGNRIGRVLSSSKRGDKDIYSVEFNYPFGVQEIDNESKPINLGRGNFMDVNNENLGKKILVFNTFNFPLPVDIDVYYAEKIEKGMKASIFWILLEGDAELLRKKGYTITKLNVPKGREPMSFGEGEFKVTSYGKGGKISDDKYYSAVNHFLFFTQNYESDWKQALNNMSANPEHFISKFNQYYKEYGTNGMFNFYFAMSGGNQHIFTNWVKENYTENKLSEMTDDEYYRAVNHFMYFTQNYPYNWYDAFGKKGDSLREHLESKYLGYYKQHGSRSAMPIFYFNLSGDRRKQLTDWAKKNYTGNKLAKGGSIKEHEGNLISTNRAREIANSWHGGQWSALYQFGSSGVYMPENHLRYLREVQQCFETEYKLKPSELPQKHKGELASLKRYFTFKGKENGIITVWQKHDVYGYMIPYVSPDTKEEIIKKIRPLKIAMEKGGIVEKEGNSFVVKLGGIKNAGMGYDWERHIYLPFTNQNGDTLYTIDAFYKGKKWYWAYKNEPPYENFSFETYDTEKEGLKSKEAKFYLGKGYALKQDNIYEVIEHDENLNKVDFVEKGRSILLPEPLLREYFPKAENFDIAQDIINKKGVQLRGKEFLAYTYYLNPMPYSVVASDEVKYVKKHGSGGEIDESQKAIAKEYGISLSPDEYDEKPIVVWEMTKAKGERFGDWESAMRWLMAEWKADENMYEYFRGNLSVSDNLIVGDQEFAGIDVQDHMTLEDKDFEEFSKGGEVDSSIINELWNGYASALLFSEMDNADQSLDANYSIEDFDSETVASTKELLANYYRKNRKAIEESEMDLNTIGNDIWYTRAGHGSGFFDHSLDKEVEKRLTDGAKKMGEYPTVEVSDSDNKIHVTGGKVFK